jgi:hypothetical protein
LPGACNRTNSELPGSCAGISIHAAADVCIC